MTHVEYSKLIENIVTGVAASVPSAGVQSVPIASSRPDRERTLGRLKTQIYSEPGGVYETLDAYIVTRNANNKDDSHAAVIAASKLQSTAFHLAEAKFAAMSGEIEINYDGATQSDGVTLAANASNNYSAPTPPADKFGSFAFKIVLRTNNSCKVPMVKNFRSIATT